MYANTRPSFAFLVLTFNHQDYILEHMESIKYLVLTHGVGIDVDVIVNDDCSRDQTRRLVDKWLQINEGLFRNVKTIYNPHNLGTCASINNMLIYLEADRCKLTAGDDVYSFENIFELTQHAPDVAIVSGRALYLLGDELVVDRLSNSLASATQVIYENDSLLNRFKHFSYNNAPNILYATECLMHPNVRTHLQRFDVTEDWPLQIAIARQFPERRFHLIDQVLVYYRRTIGSTYITANQRFVNDKIIIYDDLISLEKKQIEKIRLKVRKHLFIKKNRVLNKLLNLDSYFFILSWLIRINKINSRNRKLIINIEIHRIHYNYIRNKVISASQSFASIEITDAVTASI